MRTFSGVGLAACTGGPGSPGVFVPARRSRPRQRGSALLTVLWISAALAAVGFALANTVRGETERVSTTVDDLRSYYLATGAIDKAAIEVLWSANAQSDRVLPKG